MIAVARQDAHMRRFCIAVFATVLLAPAPFRGCSIFPPVYKVRPTLDVRVLDRGRAVAGVRVEVYDLNQEEEVSGSTKEAEEIKFVRKALAQATTDDSGIAHFSDLPKGIHEVDVVNDRNHGEWFDIEVLGGGDIENALSTVDLKWPWGLILSAKEIAGTLSSGTYNPAALSKGDMVLDRKSPLNNTALVLRNAKTLAELGSEATDNSGGFSFSAVPSGLYFLEVRTSAQSPDEINWTPNGDVIIEVAPDSSVADMDIRVIMTSCGLEYGLEGQKIN